MEAALAGHAVAVPAGLSGDARRPLRVCMVHLSDYVLDSRVQRQAQALARRGDEIHCVCLGEALDRPTGEGRIRTYPVDLSKARSGALSYVSAYGRFLAAAARLVSKLDREFEFDVVEVHNMPNLLTFAAHRPKRRGAPLVLDMHDTFPELFSTTFGLPADHLLSSLVYREESLSARGADAVLAVTDAARERLNSRGVGVGCTSVVMNSPDIEVFGEARTPVKIPAEGQIRAVYHGGTSERFGVESLMSAIGLLEKPLPRMALDVYGAFHENDQLLKLARQVGPDRIHVAERPTPFVEIPGKLAQAHIGVVPTLHDEFTELLLPVKLLEYVHMGLPVVCSRLPVIEEYFSDAEVLFFEPGSPHGLAAALAEVCREPGAAHARALGATERLQDLAWEKGQLEYLELMDRLARRREAVESTPAAVAA